jgi:hypothetical protein
MLFAAIALIVVGALLLAFVHPADADGRRLRNLGAGALIVVGVILLVVLLAGVFDTETDVELLAPALLARWRARLFNFRRDVWDRWGRGLCVEPCPRGVGYHFWRCGLDRGHDGDHRTGNYWWNAHGTRYDPDAPYARAPDRRPIRTRAQQRDVARWEAGLERERAAAG